MVARIAAGEYQSSAGHPSVAMLPGFFYGLCFLLLLHQQSMGLAGYNNLFSFDSEMQVACKTELMHHA
jgi:hypothetical protein